MEWLGVVPGHVSHETQDARSSSTAQETRCAEVSIAVMVYKIRCTCNS